MFDRRRRLAEVEGIRLTYICPAIPAGASFVINFDEEGKFARYAPYQIVTIYNNSNSSIVASVNGDADKSYPVVGKTERQIDKINCWSLRLENKGADILAGEVVVMVETEGGTSDALAKRILRWWG